MRFLLLSITTKAQNPTVEKSVTGIQIGIFGLDMYKETKLADKFSLKSEFSLLATLWAGDWYSKLDFAFYPGLTLLPKYDYNVARRSEKGKTRK